MTSAILDEFRPERRWTHVDGDNVFIAARCSPTLAFVHFHGFGGRPMIETVRESLSTILTGDQIVFYWDLFGLHQFESAFREAIVAELLPARKRLRSMPILVSSSLIAMAAMATNLTLGVPMKVFREREPFDAQLRRDLTTPP
jgi:hypothetical protein